MARMRPIEIGCDKPTDQIGVDGHGEELQMALLLKWVTASWWLVCCTLVAGLGSTPPVSAQRVQLGSGEALYPRVVRISHDPAAAANGTLVASVTSFPNGKGEEQIFSSIDGGKSFARVGIIADTEFATGLCCGTLFELPSVVGGLRAGTLLWAGSVGGDAPTRPMRIKIYHSLDRGATWSYLSDCAAGTVPRSGGGLWEPEFAVAANGSLVCFYSDETVPGHSQLIQQVVSTDGLHWSAPVQTISSGVQADRPGMVVVRRLPSGRYFMTHELCGPAACTVFYKTSPDGIDWTPATDVGRRVETADGRWFLHTPTNAWAPVPGTANGRIFVIGQILSSAGGTAAGNGRTILYNDSADGSGPWKALAAPVTIQSPPGESNFCQNYSSPLLPATDGTSILGLASDFDTSGATKVCRTYFATASTTAQASLTMAAASIRLSGSQATTAAVTLTPVGDFRGSLRLSASVPGFGGSVTFTDGGLVTFDGTAKTVQITVSPSKLAGFVGIPGAPAIGLLGLAGLTGLRRRKRFALISAALPLMLAACGGGSAGDPVPPVVSVPASQTYTATISATDVATGSVVATTTTTITTS